VVVQGGKYLMLHRVAAAAMVMDFT
jgi:hypothetical protein